MHGSRGITSTASPYSSPLAKSRKAHGRTLETKRGYASVLNIFVKWLATEEIISPAEAFFITYERSLEQRKREQQLATEMPIYSLKELFQIKRNIDRQYSSEESAQWKIRAYGLYLGLCFGLRKGQALGLRPSNLHPDSEVPFITTGDNIVSGWSRGRQGVIELKDASKTFVGKVELPALQPDVATLVEVMQFLKQSVPEQNRIVNCNPRTVDDWWKVIAKECNFRAIHPHGWKHSYATNGALNLQTMYNGNAYLLQKCCLHAKFDTTQKYLKRLKDDQFLQQFKK